MKKNAIGESVHKNKPLWMGLLFFFGIVGPLFGLSWFCVPFYPDSDYTILQTTGIWALASGFLVIGILCMHLFISFRKSSVVVTETAIRNLDSDWLAWADIHDIQPEPFYQRVRLTDRTGEHHVYIGYQVIEAITVIKYAVAKAINCKFCDVRDPFRISAAPLSRLGRWISRLLLLVPFSVLLSAVFFEPYRGYLVCLGVFLGLATLADRKKYRTRVCQGLAVDDHRISVETLNGMICIEKDDKLVSVLFFPAESGWKSLSVLLIRLDQPLPDEESPWSVDEPSSPLCRERMILESFDVLPRGSNPVAVTCALRQYLGQARKRR